MSNINIKRAVENIRSGTNIYTPVVELVVNAIQATEAANREHGLIKIRLLRASQGELLDASPEVIGFIVSDNGVGFNEANRNSFDTLYTEHKLEEGGKGFGRFTCLKYFEDFDVESTFIAAEGHYNLRTFSMGRDTEIIIDEHVAAASQSETGSSIRLHGIRQVKFQDKNIDIIARVLVEKLLPYFIDKNFSCPRIIIEEENGSGTIILNNYLSSDDNTQIVELPTPQSEICVENKEVAYDFEVRIFKFYSPRSHKSKVSLVAHRREVTEVSLQTYIPEFAEEFFDKSVEGDEGKDRNYVIKAYVFGEYLDQNVSLERGTFNFQRDSDLMYGLSQSEIEAAAAQVARRAVGEEITARRERKRNGKSAAGAGRSPSLGRPSIFREVR